MLVPVVVRYYNWCMSLLTVTNLIRFPLWSTGNGPITQYAKTENDIDLPPSLELCIVVALTECLKTFVEKFDLRYAVRVCKTPYDRFISVCEVKFNKKADFKYYCLDRLIDESLDFKLASETLLNYVMAHPKLSRDKFGFLCREETLKLLFKHQEIKRQVWCLMDRQNLSPTSTSTAVFNHMLLAPQIETDVPEVTGLCRPVEEYLRQHVHFDRNSKLDNLFMCYFLTRALITSVDQTIEARGGHRDAVLGDICDYANLYHLYIKEKAWHYKDIRKYAYDLVKDIDWQPVCLQIKNNFEFRYPQHTHQLRMSQIYEAHTLCQILQQHDCLDYCFAIMGKRQYHFVSAD